MRWHGERIVPFDRPLCGELLGDATPPGRAASQRSRRAPRYELLFDPRWNEALGHLPDYLGNHVRVSVTALALGLVISFPLALAARNRPVLRSMILGFASIVQTMPGLALLALFYPLLLLWRQ